jgi:N-acetylneuraminate synthase
MMPGEVTVRARLAKSVVAACAIPAGTVIDRSMLTLKGPGDGIAAHRIDDLVGRVAIDAVVEDTLLPEAALSWPRGGA